MKITMLETTKHEIALNTRMPFRYGIVSMTALPHLFVRVLLDVDGTRRWGMAADHLPPKWFTKNPQSSLDDDVAEMREVIDRALAIAASAGTVHTVFDLWKKIYDDQKRWAQHTPYPPLLWGFGVSLVERAVIDAFCRATKMPFARALRENLLGIRLETIYPELEGLAPADFLPRIPPAQIYVRHTVGLIDTLREKDIALTDRLDDGLPQSLEAAIRAYGLTHFKIKLAGDPDKDFAWLLRVADVLDNAKTDYRYTLDGNENYRDPDSFRLLWRRLEKEPAASGFMRRLIFVEQPFHRDIALSEEMREALRGWPDRPPVLIDESDGGFGDVPRALHCGYVGTSHKNCKGVFKGIVNAAWLHRMRLLNPDGRYFLSGEDLSNIGPVALLQDLAVQATLGIEHVERNGHHYFRGLSMFPLEMRKTVLRRHGDLYRRHEMGYPTLDIRNGRISVAGCLEAPFGTGFEPDELGLL